MKKRKQISDHISNDLKFELFDRLEEQVDGELFDQIDEELFEYVTGGSYIDIDVNLIKEQLFSHIENINGRKVG
jgi:hypothetical protein